MAARGPCTRVGPRRRLLLHALNAGVRPVASQHQRLVQDVQGTLEIGAVDK